MNNEVKKYIKDVKMLFPIFDTDEKKYYNRLRNSILKEDRNLTYNECVEKFGEPKEIVSSYFENLDSNLILYKLNKKNLIKRLVYIFITCIVIISLTACIFLYQAYQDSTKSHGTYFEEKIETTK